MFGISSAEWIVLELMGALLGGILYAVIKKRTA
jgi:hypothetical protein